MNLRVRPRIKIARYWPSSFFPKLSTEMKKRVNKKSKKKKKIISSYLTERASLVNNLLYGKERTFSFGTNGGEKSKRGQAGPISPIFNTY